MFSLLAQVCGEAVTLQSRRLFSEAAFASCWCGAAARLCQINSSESETSDLVTSGPFDVKGDQQFRAVAGLYFQFALQCDSSLPVMKPVGGSIYWKSSNALLRPLLPPFLHTHARLCSSGTLVQNVESLVHTVQTSQSFSEEPKTQKHTQPVSFDLLLLTYMCLVLYFYLSEDLLHLLEWENMAVWRSKVGFRSKLELDRDVIMNVASALNDFYGFLFLKMQKGHKEREYNQTRNDQKDAQNCHRHAKNDYWHMMN